MSKSVSKKKINLLKKKKKKKKKKDTSAPHGTLGERSTEHLTLRIPHRAIISLFFSLVFFCLCDGLCLKGNVLHPD